ncbi:hypothetical protein BDK61_2159 [Haloarcula quadrata]|uniref:Uncharacterized protein n=1 Tax=Haloarcula quadrata TaxID=182779 RepID=A0A495R695_9EURY|nr:hypothetical protein BDK61_2159 [Haloarcula quadrata]
MQFCTAHFPKDTKLKLQSDLKESEIDLVNGNTVSFKHRTSVEQSEWEHRTKMDTHGGHVAVDLPPNAVVIGFDGSAVHYCVEV